MTTHTDFMLRGAVALALILTLTFSLSSPQPVRAAIITVDSTDDTIANDGNCTLREAINNANDTTDGQTTGGECAAGNPSGGDTIDFSVTGTITLTATLEINEDLTISGPGASVLAISGGGAHRVFKVNINFYDEVTAEISDLTIRDGNSEDGGGIYNNGEALTVTNCTFSGNSADDGGVIYQSSGTATVTVTNCTFSGNSAEYDGGVIYQNSGTATVTNSTFSDNSAGRRGGGINSNNALTVTNSTIYSNTASSGGGICHSQGTATVTNSTIYSNTASSGGGIYQYCGFSWNTGTLTVTNSTLSGNSAVNGGGLYRNNERCTPHLRNTIIANSTGGDCVKNETSAVTETLATNTNNLIEDNTCSPAVSGDPNLGPLADNGGDTHTHALLPGSPAIDAGDNGTCATTDQRGVARHDGDGDSTVTCDIGAYEAGTMQCGVSAGPTYTFNDQSDLAIDVNSETDLDCLYVDEVPVNHPNATGSTDGQHLRTGDYWYIKGFQSDGETSATTFDLDLTLPYASADGGTRVCRWLEGAGSGYGWDCAADSYVADTSVTRSGLTDLSQWAVGQNVGPTALTLTGFTADTSQLPITVLALAVLVALTCLAPSRIDRKD